MGNINIGDINSIARRMSKIYAGDDYGIARQGQKVYIGDANGIARQVYSAFDPIILSYWACNVQCRSGESTSDSKDTGYILPRSRVIEAQNAGYLYVEGNLYGSFYTTDDNGRVQVYMISNNIPFGSAATKYGPSYYETISINFKESISSILAYPWNYGFRVSAIANYGAEFHGNLNNVRFTK